MEAQTVEKKRLQATCGKVTINKVQKAWNHLRWEAQTYSEKTSFIDNDGTYQTRINSFTSVFGGDAARMKEVNEFWEGVQEKIGYVLSTENYKAVVEALEAKAEAMRLSRPVADKTRPEEEEGKNHEEAKARRSVQQEKEDAEKARLMADGVEIPTGAMAVILSEHYDDSDPMTDYFNSHARTGEARCIGIVRQGSKREDLLREVVAAIPELAGIEWKYHREDYSGGHGTYLQAQSSHRTDETIKARGGLPAGVFYEVKCDKYAPRHLRHQQMVDRFTVSNVYTECQDVGGCVVSRNEAFNGIELRFNGKPSQEVLDFLKGELRARWHFRKKIWYCKYSADRMALINEKIGSIPVGLK